MYPEPPEKMLASLVRARARAGMEGRAGFWTLRIGCSVRSHRRALDLVMGPPACRDLIVSRRRVQPPGVSLSKHHDLRTRRLAIPCLFSLHMEFSAVLTAPRGSSDPCGQSLDP